ncbi:uroporphyrinogen-III C-methyltransferase [Rhodobacteraceae bacterium RKSG542]|uniref:siroheme synthase CysG n=1 Tax=Pseudovibrio flavus TaxID=2529854 RepID=UPI0012BCC8A9|nr:siroheme synthase CysG [Pseudovibrio flavus]MTI17084.1 uroporphyrinogen-III C-methyltransferase [Pseudovibrio flavus]
MSAKAEGNRNNEGKLAVFPTFSKVAGRPVVVVGDGDEAAAKVRLLSETQAHIIVVSQEPEEALLEAIDKASADLKAEVFQPHLLKDAALVFAASGDLEQDTRVVEAGRAAGIPSNAVDRPELCDFYVGALVNRAPVAVAITSTGVGPVYARHIRAKIEAMLPLEAGKLASLAESFRETVMKLLPTGKERRVFWARFFSGSVAANALAGNEQGARKNAQRLLNGPLLAQNGYVWLIGAGPGAEDLLTLRAQRVLQEADVIFYDALVPDAVVSMGRRDAERIRVGKRKGHHSASQAEINELIVESAKKGLQVVRLKAGDPMVFGRAGEELDALSREGIAHEVVPGITAAFAAAASTKLPLTLRGVASSLVFATGHDQHGQTLPDWAHLTLNGATTAVYMGRSVAGKVASQLHDAGLSLTTPVMAVESASQKTEQVFAGTLSDLGEFAARDDVSGPVLIVIGETVAYADTQSAKPLSPFKDTQMKAVAAA